MPDCTYNIEKPTEDILEHLRVNMSGRTAFATPYDYIINMMSTPLVYQIMNPSQDITSYLAKAAAITESIKNQSHSSNQKLALRFFDKIATNSKAIIILYKSHLIDEAYTIHRLSMEHLFNISALLGDPKFEEQLMAYSKAQIPKTLKAINTDDNNSEEPLLTRGNKELAEEALKNYETNPISELGYSIFNAAQKSQFPGFYNARYRQISLTHAHSTMASVLKDKNSEKGDDLLTYASDFLKIAVSLIEKEFKIESGRD
ncbi:MAG: DUF5677 domain-containing protein [Gallionella sp.]|nr:DUF5677 domain-containing protein [Gallionella sp.]